MPIPPPQSKPDPAPQNHEEEEEEEEEDYMSMVIEEPAKPRGHKETYSQMRMRKQRESEAKARTPSKAERAALDAARREEALASSTLDPSNKGFKMMAKLGFKPGSALGKQPADGSNATAAERDEWNRPRTEPLNIVVKEGKGGIGMDSEKKRKIREATEQEAKRVKAEEGDFRERMRLEREDQRTEALFLAAQKVAERLDNEDEAAEAERQTKESGDKEEEATGTGTDEDTAGVPTAEERNEREKRRERDQKARSQAKLKTKPTSQINVLYRGLIREREENQRSLRARHLLQTSLPTAFTPSPSLKLPTYADADGEGTTELDSDDRLAVGLDPDYANLEEEIEEEDPELEAFNALDAKERLRRAVQYLREDHLYCFWCKHQYETVNDLEGCPGVNEEDHD